MTRSERIQPVQRVMGEDEKRAARRVADAQRKLSDAEKKLGELQDYQRDYELNFTRRVADGASGLALRDYQAFLARLAEAVRQQGLVVAGARQEVVLETRLWQGAAVRVKALDTVVTQWRSEEFREQERREQVASDELSQQLLRRRKETP
ncbi:MAG: hypothetical protein RLZZ200_882 [Pseudomonadota bacterium]|jgi:flagellar FliJ protein